MMRELESNMQMPMTDYLFTLSVTITITSVLQGSIMKNFIFEDFEKSYFILITFKMLFNVIFWGFNAFN